MRALERRMTEELGWVDSQQNPSEHYEEEQHSVESSDRYPRSHNPDDTGASRNVGPETLWSDGDVADSLAAHDARTCGCKTLARIRASIEKTATVNHIDFTDAQIRLHVKNIDAINRKTHLLRNEQTGTQASGPVTHSRQHQRGEC